MSVKITAADILPCVYRFLIKYGFSEAAEAIEEAGGDVSAKGGISSRKLMKICKFYLQHHPELQVQNEEEEEDEEEVKPKAKAAAASKTKPKVETNGKRKQSIQEEEEEEEVESKTNKKVKTEAKSKETKKEEPKKKEEVNKKAASKSAIQDFDEEEEEEDDKPQIKVKSVADGLKNNKNSNNSTKNGYQNNSYEGYEEEEDVSPTQKRFSYVDPTVIDEIPEHFRDNTFEAKYRYGQGGDEFGKIGNEKLKDTRGKGFKKEKGKLKNKQFQGGGSRIDAHTVNSIKFRFTEDD